MRDALVAKLCELAARDERICVLSGDIGYGVFDKFRADFPGRFVNTGIAEQNMMGVAAGLALSGKRPVVYTIVPFATMRCYEQIRVDVCMHDLPVTIVGVGGGLSYGSLGPTHHAIEDVAIMRALPNMRISVPSDPPHAQSALYWALFHDWHPHYIRLGKNGEPELKREVLVGADVLILACGPIFKEAQEAADRIASRGVRCAAHAVETMKPFDSGGVILATPAKLIVTLEEHSVVGGLGSAAAEVIAEHGLGKRLLRLGVPDEFVSAVGDREYLLRELFLDAKSVADIVMETL